VRVGDRRTVSLRLVQAKLARPYPKKQNTKDVEGEGELK
jgi:hypothetical protein